MKKIIAIFLVLFLATGCDGDSEMLSCSNTTTQNGIITKTGYDVEYVDDEVKFVTITYDYSVADDVDGVNADTDGLSENKHNNNVRARTNNNDNNMDNNQNNSNSNNTNGDNNTRNADGNNTTTGNNNDNTSTYGNTDGNGVTNNNNTNGNNTTTGNMNGNNNNGSINNHNGTTTDDIVDGVVGDALDTAVDSVRETILDIAGIRNNYENQLSTYDNIEGFSYDVDVNNDNEYRIIYKIDMTKISDTDLALFNVSRDFSGMESNYEDLGYTCR